MTGRAATACGAVAVLALGCAQARPPHTPAAPGDHGHEGAHACGHASHRFDDAQRWAAVFDDPERDVWQRPDEVIARAGIAPGTTVVDLGAGTGYFLSRLARAVGGNGAVIALDVEPTLVAHMKARVAREGFANVDVRLVAPDDPALAAASVSRILVVDTWHHIADRVAYARKLQAALVRGGSVVVVDFTADAQRGPPPEHRLAPDQVVRELAAAGLDASVVTETLPDQYIVVGTRPTDAVR